MNMELLPWADEEHELLGEALSLLADWEDGAHSAVDQRVPRDASPEGDSRQPDDPQTERRPVKINHSRERQKQEIRSLQQCVVELESEVARLQNKGSKHPRGGVSSAVVAANSGTVAWEHAARRQFRARRKAETVNARLREMLATQKGIADDLMRVIQRAERARQEAQDFGIFSMHSPTVMLQDPVNDQQLQLRLMKISAEWHVPFNKCDKFHNRPGQPRQLLFHDVVTTFNDIDELVMDVRASTPTTFALQPVEDVLWGYFLKMRCTEDDFSLATESLESVDTLVGHLRACACHDGINGVLNSRFMKQRFRNMDGELVIATSLCGRPDLTSTNSPSDSQLAKIEAVLFEDSWLRVLRIEDPHGSSSTDITLIQHVRRTRIQFCGLLKPDRTQVAAVEKFMTRLAENELRFGQEVMDRSLMQGSAKLLR